MNDDAIRTRLRQLKAELASGQEVMAKLDAKRLELERTLLRISGAIQVLDDLLAAHGNNDAGPAGASQDAADLAPRAGSDDELAATQEAIDHALDA